VQRDRVPQRRRAEDDAVPPDADLRQPQQRLLREEGHPRVGLRGAREVERAGAAEREDGGEELGGEAPDGRGEAVAVGLARFEGGAVGGEAGDFGFEACYFGVALFELF
jgi:hypothetical protein